MRKRTQFRQGQKMEIGFDLMKNYTGHKTGGAMNTAQGEMMSNYFSNSENSLLTSQAPKNKQK